MLDCPQNSNWEKLKMKCKTDQCGSQPCSLSKEMTSQLNIYAVNSQNMWISDSLLQHNSSRREKCDFLDFFQTENVPGKKNMSITLE